ncbi:MAG: Hpt domain-containing protein [Oligoflexia bacterium]|nr:Hpt domain-containing protein [Oligoflexia bacterium]
MPNPEIVNIFLEEAFDVVSQWERECLKLEKSNRAPDFNGLFRCIHNLKGVSRSVGLVEFGEFVCNMEEVVVLLKTGRLQLMPKVIEFLLDCQNLLVSWLQNLQKSMDYPVETKSLLLKMEAIKEYVFCMEDRNDKSDGKVCTLFVEDVSLNWQLMIGMSDFDVNMKFLKGSGGIFLCIFNGNPKRIYYIGETNNFYERFVKYFSDHISGISINYKLGVDEDFVNLIKNEFNGKTVTEVVNGGKIHLPSNISKFGQSFERSFFSEEQYRERKHLIEKSLFAFATIEGPNDNLLRKEITGGLISKLRKAYQDISKTELKLQERSKCDLPIGDVDICPTYDYRINHKGKICELLPKEFINITEYLTKF